MAKVTLTILLVMVAFPGCSKKESTREKDALQSDFLPLAVGNTWVYRNSIPQGKHAYFQRAILMKQRGAKSKELGYFITTGRTHVQDTDRQPVDCLDTYRIIEPGETSGSWRVEISVPESKCGGDNLRDGRYGNASKIFWSKELIDTPGRPTPGKEILGYLREKIIYDRNQLPPGWKEDVVEPVEEIRNLGVLWKILPPKGESYFSVTIEMSRNAKLYAADKALSVKTPAGNFENCLEVKEDMTVQKGDDRKDPWSTGWTTHRYFCAKIGLVKELQKNRSGEILYSLELVKYELAGSN